MLRPKTGAGLGILEVNNRRNEIRFRRERVINLLEPGKGFLKNTKEYVHFLLVSCQDYAIFQFG